jgi:D-xylose transport system permease protein
MSTTPETNVDAGSLPTEQASGFALDVEEKTIPVAFRDWVGRLRTGDPGALPAVLGLIVLALIFSQVSGRFFSFLNLGNLPGQGAYIAVIALGLVFVLLLGEIDLSAGVTSGMTMALFIVLVNVNGVPWILALGVAFAVGILTGTFIGFFVARVGIPSFVVTLGLFLGYQGITLWIIGAGGLYRVQIPEITAIQNANMPVWAGWVMLLVVLAVSAATSFWDRARRRRAGVANRTIALVWIKLAVIAVVGGAAIAILSRNRGQSVGVVEGVPIVVPIVLVILWIGTFVLDRTRYGRYLYAIGGNAEAARRSGVKVMLIRWTAFICCSTLAVVSGLFSISKVGSVDAAAGREIVLSGVAAAVVGGVSLFGGRGRLLHAAIGALVIAVITNGLGLLNLPAGVNLVVTGSVLILAATVDAISRVRAGGSVMRS